MRKKEVELHMQETIAWLNQLCSPIKEYKLIISNSGYTVIEYNKYTHYIRSSTADITRVFRDINTLANTEILRRF